MELQLEEEPVTALSAPVVLPGPVAVAEAKKPDKLEKWGTKTHSGKSRRRCRSPSLCVLRWSAWTA